MTRAATTIDPLPLEYAPPPPGGASPREPGLARELIVLALPILAESVLHMTVGLTDVFLAGHLPTHAADATAAVGVVGYVLWLIGLITGAIGVGSTAIISRAVGA